MQVAEQDWNPGPPPGPGPVLLACWPTSPSPPPQGAGKPSPQSHLGPGPARATVTAGRALARALPVDSGGSVCAMRFLGPSCSGRGARRLDEVLASRPAPACTWRGGHLSLSPPRSL